MPLHVPKQFQKKKKKGKTKKLKIGFEKEVEASTWKGKGRDWRTPWPRHGSQIWREQPSAQPRRRLGRSWRAKPRVAAAQRRLRSDSLNCSPPPAVLALFHSLAHTPTHRHGPLSLSISIFRFFKCYYKNWRKSELKRFRENIK